ncbi:MAG: RluA family pseudouridine synthase [Ottowia sp.]|nr:RluA family pseudouridine synthase [Ottowia sp.]
MSVPGRGPDKADCLWTRALERWPEALVVHRLDQATSGLMLFARNADVQRQLGTAFAHQRVHRYYEAVVHGAVHGTPDRDGWSNIRLPIGRAWLQRPRRHIDTLLGKPSLTRYRPLATDPATHTSRIALQAITGRTHQLRVHLQAIGHPIVGDALYGRTDGAPRMMLHACRLQLVHPGTGRELLLQDAPDF